ncbi:MAG: c-type cytochrome, partial [Verrucomicrobiae bacterium]|nr:c-type cytochrome [Verrucomicrobiae bacterium]
LPVETRSEEPPLDPFDESQLASTSSAMRLAHAAATGALDDVGKKRAIEAGLSSPRPEVRALFERFRPPAERPLPHRHQAATILKLTGDPDSGSAILSPTGKLAVCFSCHRIGEAGIDFGPNLSDVGSRLSRETLLESILEPSRTVVPEFALWTVEIAKGEAVTGLTAEKTKDILTLKIGPGVSREIGLAEVIRQSPSAASAMPEGLADFLEPQEVADLLAAMAALKAKGD